MKKNQNLHDPVTEEIQRTLKSEERFLFLTVLSLIVLPVLAVIMGIVILVVYDFDLESIFAILVIIEIISVRNAIKTTIKNESRLHLKANLKNLDNTYTIMKLLEAQADEDIITKLENTDNEPQPTTPSYHRFRCPNCDTIIEKWPCSNCGHTPTEHKAVSPVPQYIFSDDDGKIACPVCNTIQRSNRYCCFNCGQVFVNGQPGIPYWCDKCGNEGPFGNFCPKCGSDSKIYNT